MKGRKTANQATRKKKIHQKLNAYLTNQKKAEQDFSQTFEEYLSFNQLNSSFRKLHLYLESNMMVEIKKNVVIEDGVYILLEGSVTYIWTKNRHDRNRKDHLLSLAKTGVFSNLSESFAERNFLLANGYSILINSHFAVLQSQNANIHTNQDSLFLHITPKILQLTQFNALKSQRQDIVSRAKLPGSWSFPQQSLISMNLNLHHTFKKKILTFRSRFQVASLGIINKGNAKYKPNRSQGQIQFSKYCLLLPGFQFQVSSSQLQIIQIQKNPTIMFKKPLIFSKFISELTTRASLHQNSYQQNHSKQKQKQKQKQKLQVKKYCHRINNSISMHKQNTSSCSLPNSSFRKQEKNKKKDFQIFAKQNQDYWIVSTQLCKENLRNLKIMKNKIKALTFQRQNNSNNSCNSNSNSKNNKKPEILFNFSKNKKNDTFRKNHHQNSQPSQNSTTLRAINNKNTINTGSFSSSTGNNNNKYLQRYENYAKQIYQQFIKCQGKK